MKRDPELFPIWWIYALLAIVLLAVFGCVDGEPTPINYSSPSGEVRQVVAITWGQGLVGQVVAVRDTTAGVICYMYRGTGISCLYDEVEP